MGFGFIERTMKSITAILASRGSVNAAVEIILPLVQGLEPVIERAEQVAHAARQFKLDTVVTSNPFGGVVKIKGETGLCDFKFSSVIFEAGLNKNTVLVFSHGSKSLAVRSLTFGEHLFHPQETAVS